MWHQRRIRLRPQPRGFHLVTREVEEAVPELRRLVLAIRAACGIEALVWLTDVAGLSRQEASELMRWSALALLRTALAEADERRGSR